MQYDDFISSVQARGGRPRDETETLVHATLRVLAERLTAGEADDLRAQLPGALQVDHIPPEPEAQPFGPDEFARRVAPMARLPEKEARDGMVTVLATTRDAVEPGEFDDVLSQLGEEYARLVPGSGSPDELGGPGPCPRLVLRRGTVVRPPLRDHRHRATPNGGVVSESGLEETGTGEAAKRIGQAPTTTDVTDPERSSRNTAAGSGSEPGEGPVRPDADEGMDPSASIKPHNEGFV